MKTSRFISHSLAFGGLALAASSAFAASQASYDQTRPFISAVVTPVPADPTSTATAIANSWDDIKTLTYEQKAEFITGLGRLENKIDGQIGELKVQRAKMKNDNKEWDFAMRNFDDARNYLKSMSAELKDATAETWNNEKEKVQRAWQSTQEAYDKVKATTTQS